MCDEDEPAPSPSATVVARRASREAKSMREESGCDEDTSSDEEWDPVQEQDEEDEEDERRVRRKHPLYSKSKSPGSGAQRTRRSLDEFYAAHRARRG